MQAVVKTLLAKFFTEKEPCSVEIMVSGNVPPGSGLSVSASTSSLMAELGRFRRRRRIDGSGRQRKVVHQG